MLDHKIKENNYLMSSLIFIKKMQSWKNSYKKSPDKLMNSKIKSNKKNHKYKKCISNPQLINVITKNSMLT